MMLMTRQRIQWAPSSRYAGERAGERGERCDSTARARRLVIPTILLLLLVVGCRQSSTAPSGLPTVSMQVGQKTFTLEVANNDDTRQRGLMRRDTMPASWGMIFVFADADERAFWMENTRIPLDIIYLDESGKVISIKQMKPYDRSTVSSDGKARWAIELNQGAAAGAGVKVGDNLKIPESARTAMP